MVTLLPESDNNVHEAASLDPETAARVGAMIESGKKFPVSKQVLRIGEMIERGKRRLAQNQRLLTNY